MLTLTCTRCTATAKCNSESEGRDMLDHSIGLSVGIKCGNSFGFVKVSGDVESTNVMEDVFKKPQSKKSKST
jgi:hypothetical protein